MINGPAQPLIAWPRCTSQKYFPPGGHRRRIPEPREIKSTASSIVARTPFFSMTYDVNGITGMYMIGPHAEKKEKRREKEEKRVKLKRRVLKQG